MNTTLTLTADSFRYPTQEERRRIREIIPEISQFNPAYKSAIIDIIINGYADSAIRNEDIYWWCNCVNNRIGKIEETFIYVKTHQYRVDSNNITDSVITFTDRILLEYYIEIFYYYFFSFRDLLGQLLNIYFDLKIDEKGKFFNKEFMGKIKSDPIKTPLVDFLKMTHNSSNIRNSFVHRFTPTHRDLRSSVNIKKDNHIINFDMPQEVKVGEFVEDIENMIRYLSVLMEKLTKEII